MAVTGYLVPYPDPGAFDLMSRWLEQDVDAGGPGAILVRVTMPRIVQLPEETVSEPGNGFARKKLELFRQRRGDWELVSESATPSPDPSEEVRWPVADAGVYRARLTNMGGLEGQFSLDCRFVPD